MGLWSDANASAEMSRNLSAAKVNLNYAMSSASDRDPTEERVTATPSVRLDSSLNSGNGAHRTRATRHVFSKAIFVADTGTIAYRDLAWSRVRRAGHSRLLDPRLQRGGSRRAPRVDRCVWESRTYLARAMEVMGDDAPAMLHTWEVLQQHGQTAEVESRAREPVCDSRARGYSSVRDGGSSTVTFSVKSGDSAAGAGCSRRSAFRWVRFSSLTCCRSCRARSFWRFRMDRDFAGKWITSRSLLGPELCRVSRGS